MTNFIAISSSTKAREDDLMAIGLFHWRLNSKYVIPSSPGWRLEHKYKEYGDRENAVHEKESWESLCQCGTKIFIVATWSCMLVSHEGVSVASTCSAEHERKDSESSRSIEMQS